MSNDLRNRDEELGRRLAELEVPEHRPDFFPSLRFRLAEGRADRNTLARQRRRTRRSRTRFALRVAVVAAVVAIVVLFVGLPRDERVPDVVQPAIATAATIKAEVRAALARAEGLRGVLVYDGSRRGNEQRWTFAMTANGDFRLIGITLVENVTYDSATGIERSLNPSASVGGDTLFAAERRGVAPGPPDGGPSSWILPRNFGAVVRALLAAEDPRVRETTYEGRPAWQLDINVVPNAIVPEFSGDRFEITVDRATGMPVRIVEKRHGAFLSELRIEDLVVDPELAPDAFMLDFPPKAEVMRSDDGFRRVELGDVARIVGYAPLVPSYVPEGFELAEVAVARRAGPTGAEAANPASRRVVSLSYRRGLDQFIVTTRLARVPVPGEPDLPLEQRWSDPLATGEGFRDEPETVTIRGGALEGVAAEVLIVPRAIPHLWALAGELVLTVGGDLSRAELMHVTQSLASGG